jgi:hypothetical protein
VVTVRNADCVERLTMCRLLVALVLLFVLCSSAMAQLNVVPGGAMAPNHGLQYIVPSGAPFSYSHYPPAAYYGFGWRPSAPISWLSYPFVPVPVTRDDSVMVEVRPFEGVEK